MRRIDDNMAVSGQVFAEDLPRLAAQGVRMIVNNRPDGEETGQPEGAEIARAAEEAGLAYRHVPVGTTGLSANQVAAMVEALDAADGPVLAFCKSGTRSTWLWALAKARQGEDAETLVSKAAEAGYDLTPIRPYLG